jgi:hypothetical protein
MPQPVMMILFTRVSISEISGMFSFLTYMTAGTNDRLPFLLKKIPKAPPAHPEFEDSR